jgi:hypothetical protein
VWFDGREESDEDTEGNGSEVEAFGMCWIMKPFLDLRKRLAAIGRASGGGIQCE